MSGLRAAKLEGSPRLQRTLLFLADGQPHSTRDIVRHADVVAVNSVVAELRQNGWHIDCAQPQKGRFTYQLHEWQTKAACDRLMEIDAQRAA